jgi:ketosteroid isomerase-like protein
MRRFALVIAFMAGLNAQAFSQKAEIEAVNAKWMELFNKGDFAGIGSLYTEDATALPPGSAMEGKSRNRGDVEKHGRASH